MGFFELCVGKIFQMAPNKAVFKLFFGFIFILLVVFVENRFEVIINVEKKYLNFLTVLHIPKTAFTLCYM